MNKFQEFFSKKWLLVVAPILYFIGVVGMDVIIMIDDARSGIYYLGGDIFIASVVLIACLSYAKHNKNIMKAVVGAILVYTCIICIDTALCYTLYFDPEYDTALDVVIAVLRAALSIMFFVIHLVLGSKHKSNSLAVKLNLIVGLLIIAVAIAWEVSGLILGNVSILYAIFWVCFNIGLVALVMNIESKIDFFKQIRDEREKEAAEAEATEEAIEEATEADAEQATEETDAQ